MSIKDHLIKLTMWWQEALKLRNDRPGGRPPPMHTRQLRHWMQSNIFTQDFDIDHKVTMELRSRECLGQSNIYNLCFLKISFTFRKCTFHICNVFFNYANAFAWMRRILNWHKWTCSRKAKTVPEDLFGVFNIPHWNRQDLTAHRFWSWQICCASLEQKIIFHLKTTLFSSFRQSNLYVFCPF